MLIIDSFGFATDEIRCHVRELTENPIKCESGWGVNENTIRFTKEDFPDAKIRVGEAVRWEWSFTVD